MFVSYIIERWIKLISTYIIATVFIFGIFFSISFLREPVYRTSFSLHPRGNLIPVSHTIENLFEFIMLKDSTSFGHFLKFDMNQVHRIKSAEYDILEGGIIEISVVAKDTEIILPFYNSLISYINSDSLLNYENFFARMRIDMEMELINLEMGKLNSNSDNAESTQWQLSMGSSKIEPQISVSPSINRLFLLNRLNELAIERHNLVNLIPLNFPIIPSKTEKPNKTIYFIFTNIIVLSLMFVQYLLYVNKNGNTLGQSD